MLLPQRSSPHQRDESRAAPPRQKSGHILLSDGCVVRRQYIRPRLPSNTPFASTALHRLSGSTCREYSVAGSPPCGRDGGTADLPNHHQERERERERERDSNPLLSNSSPITFLMNFIFQAVDHVFMSFPRVHCKVSWRKIARQHWAVLLCSHCFTCFL